MLGGLRRQCLGNEEFCSNGVGTTLTDDVKMVARMSVVRNTSKTFMSIIILSRDARIEENGQAGWSVQASSRNHSIDISIKKKDMLH